MCQIVTQYDEHTADVDQFVSNKDNSDNGEADNEDIMSNQIVDEEQFKEKILNAEIKL